MSALNSGIAPRTARLTAEYTTPQALLAAVGDVSRDCVWGAGLDGSLYSIRWSGNQPPAPAAAEGTPAGSAAQAGSNNAENKEAGKPPRAAAEAKWRLHDNYVSSLALDADTLVSASFDRTLAWWNVPTGELVRRVDAHEGWVRKVAFLPGGERLVSAGDDMLVKIWERASGRCLATLAGHARQSPQGFATAVYAVAVHPQEPLVATADRTGDVFVWDVSSGKPLTQFRAPEFYTYDSVKRARSMGGIRALAFSPDGQHLALGGIGQITNVDGFVGPCRLEVWDWRAARRSHAAQGKHQAIQNDVRFGPAPWILSAGGGDGGGNLAFWTTADESPVQLVKPAGHVHQLVVSDGGRRIVLAGHGGFQVWELSEEAT